MNNLRDKWDSWQAKYLLLFIGVFSLLVIGFIVEINSTNFLYDYIRKSAKEEITTWLSFVSGAAASSVAFIAWYKLREIHNQSEAHFLLRIDERWGNNESIKARSVIHKLYHEISERHKSGLEDIPFTERDVFIQAKLGSEIILLSKNITLTDDFIYLLNFLDFMESIAFLVEEKHVSARKLNILCGESIIFNYIIFQPYIQQRRVRHGNKNFYKCFENLYKEMIKEVESQK